MAIASDGPVDPEQAVSAIRSGDTVMVGGFGLVGAPLTLIDALVETSDAEDLTIVSNNIGEPGRGLGKLLRQGRIKRGISSYFTSNPEAVAAVNAGEIEATLMPQGTFAEAIRAAGAGIAGFLTPVGAGHAAGGGQGGARIVDGVPHVLERPLHADVALVYAARGDELGNLWYRRTARNFNPLMATAARVTIAEVGELVPTGDLDAESIHTPHLYVDELVLSQMTADVKLAIAARAAQELRPGEIVNLGIGIPNLVPGLLGDDAGVFLHTENGLLGVGPRPGEGEVDPDLIDAAKQPVTALAGRRVLRQRGQLRHDPRRSCRRRRPRRPPGLDPWATSRTGPFPGRTSWGSGGAMDLVVGARRVIVTMTATLVGRGAEGRRGVHVSADRARRRRRRHHRALRLPASRRRARPHRIARGRDRRAGASRNGSVVRHRPGGSPCGLRRHSPAFRTARS